jgi:hypothetical protein
MYQGGCMMDQQHQSNSNEANSPVTRLTGLLGLKGCNLLGEQVTRVQYFPFPDVRKYTEPANAENNDSGR